MLKVLHDLRFKVGMPRLEALQLAFNILNFIRPGGIAPLPEQAQQKTEEVARECLARPSGRM
jgi:hypothetical protein